MSITSPARTMSERFMAAVPAANTGDFSAFMDLWADDAVWQDGGRNPYAGAHRGKAAIEQWFTTMMRDLGVHAEPLDMLEDETHFVFMIHLTGERDGKQIDQIHANAWHVQDGQFVSGYFLPDDQAAWDAFLQ